MKPGRPFFKLEALGNDFVLLDHRQGEQDPSPEEIRTLANRHTGIGFDQLLILKPAEDDSADLAVAIFNQDASPAQQCGNGMRAVARWLEDEQPERQTFVLATPAGPVSTQHLGRKGIRVQMGEPRFGPGVNGLPENFAIEALVGDIPGLISTGLVSMGNPHLVLELDRAPAQELVEISGGRISKHPSFADGINVSFAHLASKDRIQLRVHERGVGPTLACGSAACATGAFFIQQARARSPVRVEQPGGQLVIDWRGENEPLWMTGPARRVFNGTMVT